MTPFPRRWFSVLFAFTLLALPMLACGGSGAQPAPKVIRRVVLDCPDCKAAGQPANIWSDQALSTVACRLQWGDVVNMLEVSVDKSLARVQGGNCSGWVRVSLFRNVSASTPVPGHPHASVDTVLRVSPKPGAAMAGIVTAKQRLYLVAQTADGRWLQVNTGGWIRTSEVGNAPSGLPVAGMATGRPEP